jgi:hypothetical protein
MVAKLAIITINFLRIIKFIAINQVNHVMVRITLYGKMRILTGTM